MRIPMAVLSLVLMAFFAVGQVPVLRALVGFKMALVASWQTGLPDAAGRLLAGELRCNACALVDATEALSAAPVPGRIPVPAEGECRFVIPVLPSLPDDLSLSSRALPPVVRRIQMPDGPVVTPPVPPPRA